MSTGVSSLKVLNSLDARHSPSQCRMYRLSSSVSSDLETLKKTISSHCHYFSQTFVMLITSTLKTSWWSLWRQLGIVLQEERKIWNNLKLKNNITPFSDKQLKHPFSNRRPERPERPERPLHERKQIDQTTTINQTTKKRRTSRLKDSTDDESVSQRQEAKRKRWNDHLHRLSHQVMKIYV